MAIVNARGFWSSTGFSMFCFVLAVFFKISLKRIFFIFGADKFGQVVITRNFLNGHGMSIDTVELTNLGHTIYQNSPDWAIGYNFLLSVFLVFTDNDFILSTLLIDCISAIIFCWYLLKLYRMMGFPSWLINCMLVFQGLFISRELEMSAHTDFLAMTLMLAAVYYLTKFLSATPKQNLHIYFGSFLLMSTGLVRYQYIPVTIVLLFLTLLLTFYKKKRQHIKPTIFSLAGLLLFFGLLIVYLYSNAENTFFLSKIKSGFFPGNLLQTYPFVPASFFNLHFLATQSTIITGIDYNMWLHVAKWINFPAFVFLAFIFLRYLWSHRFRSINMAETFLLLGGLSAFLILGELIFLAVTKDRDIGPPLFSWSFVVSGRYFAFVQLFIQIAVAWWLFCEPKNTTIKNVIKKIFLVIIFIQIFHGAYYVTKKLKHPVPLDHTIIQYPLSTSVINFIKEETTKDTERKVIVTAFDKQYGFLASLYGATGYFNPGELNRILPQSKKKAVLLLMVRKKEMPYVFAFLKRPGVQYLYQLQDYFYYTYYVEPSAVLRR